MNTPAHRLTNINRQIEDIRVMLSSINDILGNIQSEVDILKAESSSKTQINSIPINNLTLISEEELKTKLSNDTFRTARIIRQQEEEDDTNELLLGQTAGPEPRKDRQTELYIHYTVQLHYTLHHKGQRQ